MAAAVRLIGAVRRLRRRFGSVDAWRAARDDATAPDCGRRSGWHPLLHFRSHRRTDDEDGSAVTGIRLRQRGAPLDVLHIVPSQPAVVDTERGVGGRNRRRDDAGWPDRWHCAHTVAWALPDAI